VTSFFNFICDNIKGNFGGMTIKIMKQEQEQFHLIFYSGSVGKIN
jgi:hypothetical protein